MKMILALILSLISACAAGAQPLFENALCDSTLRVDYIFSADSSTVAVSLDRQVKFPGWAGRRKHLSELPYKAAGVITMTDAASGDTLYRTSFSSLFREWLDTGERATRPRAFQNSFLLPLPQRDAMIDIELLDSRMRLMASMRHRYSPEDVLVEKRGESACSVTTIHRGSDVDRAIDVAILPEGYTEAERDSFLLHAKVMVDELLSYEPFSRDKSKWNFVAVWVPSEQSGVSIPAKGEWVKTPFSSHFSTFYSDRYLTTERLQDVHNALTGVPYEHVVILANTEQYGGGGIYNSYMLTAAKHPMFRPVAVHEFGHSFGGLADEYFYEGDVMEGSYPTDIEPWEPNITTLVDFPSKWQNLQDPGTPVPTTIDKARQ